MKGVLIKNGGKSDCEGERTISVLTKLDLVEQADVRNLVDTLRQLPLQLGYVGVKCRSKADLMSGLNIPVNFIEISICLCKGCIDS